MWRALILHQGVNRINLIDSSQECSFKLDSAKAWEISAAVWSNFYYLLNLEQAQSGHRHL
jgi:hypothetical protein